MYMLIHLELIDQPENSKRIRNSFQCDLQFNGKFESGNLAAAVRISKKQYWVYMREDTNTHGLRQWFYFQVVCNRPLKIMFRIYKYTKKHSLYKYGMKPYMKNEGEQWQQKGEQVSYEYDEEAKCYFVKFVYQFQKERERVEIASMPPYTYSKLKRYVGECALKYPFRVQNLGFSLGGVEIPMITASKGETLNQADRLTTEEKYQFTTEQKQIQNIAFSKVKKKAIIIMGRTHPAETCSNFTIQSIIQRLAVNQQLLEYYDIYIIPMINPDGVIVGNHRTSLVGVDLNRKFRVNFGQNDLFPEVDIVREFIKRIHKTQKIQFLLDFHGHSAKRNIFAYGEEETLRSEKHFKSNHCIYSGRILPKLLSDSLSSFKYNFCVFQKIRQKSSTARVYFSQKYGIDAITFEQSYGLVQKQRISINHWRQFGEAVMSALLEYTQSYSQNTSRMQQYLQNQIDLQQIQRKKALAKRKSLKTSQQVQQISNDKTMNGSFQFKFLGDRGYSERFNPMKTVEEQDLQSQSSLQSADQDLQITDAELQALRSNIFGKKKQTPRTPYLLPDTKIQLYDKAGEMKVMHDEKTQLANDQKKQIVHEQKMPIISRIMKMREKRRTSLELVDMLTQRKSKDERQLRQKINQLSIKLPNISRYIT